jgi:hypothetical protein
MKCNCGYWGPGDVINKQKSDAGSFWQCPQCKSSKGITEIEAIDKLLHNIAWGENKEFFKEEPDVYMTYNSILKRIKCNIWLIKAREKNFWEQSDVWLTIKEFRFAYKWAEQRQELARNNKGEFTHTTNQFFNVNCEICKAGDVDDQCKYYVRGLLGACKGKMMETMLEAVSQSADKFIDAVQNAI